MEEIYRVYPHNPPHLFLPNAAYIITARMRNQKEVMDTAEKKAFFFHELVTQAESFHWQLEAWAILGNHDHLVGRGGEALEVQYRSQITVRHEWRAARLPLVPHGPPQGQPRPAYPGTMTSATP